MAEGEVNANLHTISQANNLFTFDLYKVLAEDQGNLFFSPVSIQVILALVFLGARGDTAKQMARGLRLPEDRNVTEDGVSNIMRQLKDSNDVMLDIANRVFLNNGLSIKQQFNQSAVRFVAGLEEVDFGQEETARGIINTWVENKTNHKIKEIIPAGVVNALTRMVLVNAIYFKGDWWKKFNKENTSPEPFFTTPATTINVDMMNVLENFQYNEINELKSQVLLLPYQGNRLKMMIFLPREINGLPDLEKNLTNINLENVISGMHKRQVRVYLPKFKMEYEKSLEEVLKKLGMTSMFSNKANFSGISDEPLEVSKVLHKAFIEVNEEGTEAAAATAGFIRLMASKDFGLPPPVIFKADHPFLFFIWDQQTKSVIFAGRYSAPPTAA